ncbi:MAG: AraC family transcriptional regulator [Rubrivivax sp.]|jgi:AraC-like DNA-binding protein|nr:AraC family transcriptional regulator [Rubrivivax sp.]
MSDRLSALLQRFELHARVFHSGALCGKADVEGSTGVGHLHLVRRGPLGVTDTQGRHSVVSEPSVLFFPRAGAHQLDGGEREGADVVCASIDFGAGDENPLLRGLPAMLSVPLAQLPGLDLTQQLLFTEAQASRCGHGAVVDRLAEVLVIQLLRHAMAHQLVDGGVMAGLADPRLAKAISALHAEPARAWTLDAMAARAGMSRARFAAHFTRTVGIPPGDYLTGWRMGLARSLLRKGLPVKQVSAEVGYASPGAFGRVFLQRLGSTPLQWQHHDAATRT